MGLMARLKYSGEMGADYDAFLEELGFPRSSHTCPDCGQQARLIDPSQGLHVCPNSDSGFRVVRRRSRSRLPPGRVTSLFAGYREQRSVAEVRDEEEEGGTTDHGEQAGEARPVVPRRIAAARALRGLLLWSITVCVAASLVAIAWACVRLAWP